MGQKPSPPHGENNLCQPPHLAGPSFFNKKPACTMKGLFIISIILVLACVLENVKGNENSVEKVGEEARGELRTVREAMPGKKERKKSRGGKQKKTRKRKGKKDRKSKRKSKKTDKKKSRNKKRERKSQKSRRKSKSGQKGKKGSKQRKNKKRKRVNKKKKQ